MWPMNPRSVLTDQLHCCLFFPMPFFLSFSGFSDTQRCLWCAVAESLYPWLPGTPWDPLQLSHYLCLPWTGTQLPLWTEVKCVDYHLMLALPRTQELCPECKFTVPY